jgi:hypothetical protein
VIVITLRVSIMPSYRVTLAVGALAPGVSPDRVLPTAKSAAAELATVEAADVQVVSGQARVVIRFAEDDTELAQQIGSHVAWATGRVAEVTSWRITERVGGRWEPV